MRSVRRFALLVALPCLALAEPPKNEAETLFRAMEKKLSSAKTLHVVCKAREPREKGDQHDATFWLAGEKFRGDFDWASTSHGESQWSVFSAEGLCWDSRRAHAKREASKTVGAAAAIGFARTGTWAISELSSALGAGMDAGDGTRWELSDFKLGKKEKDLQAIEYAVNSGKRDAMTYTLWIDVKTQLPVKRDVDMDGWKLHETYEVRIDEKVAEELFK